MNEEFKRKLTAILSADVAGYSRLMDDDEEATIRTLKNYRSLIAETVEKHRGRVVDSPGDNILAEFSSVVDAVKCSVEIQQELSKKNAELTNDRKMRFRIGINLGDVVEEDDRIYGDGVNIAARVESFAEAGGICISGRVYDNIENKLKYDYEFLGEKTAKNIRRPIRVFKIPIEIESEAKSDESILDSIIDLSVPTDKPSIAVLPFVNMSGDPEQEYFSDGMTETIITALAKIPDIMVIASTSTFTYKGQKVKVQQVGKELGVKYVLEGSVQKAGNRIRLTAQLIDAKSENHLWAERYDRNLEDIFDLEDELTTRILEELNIWLWNDVRESMKVKGTNNLKAYLKYWQGMQYYFRFNKNDSLLARKAFEDVINLDPDWAEGYAILGSFYITCYWNGWSSSPEKFIQNAEEYSQRAISIDDTIPTSYVTLSTIYTLKRQYDKAIIEAEKAITIQPNFHVGYFTLGYALVYSERYREAEEMYKKAIRFSPKSFLTKLFWGITYLSSGKYSEAINAIKTFILNSPDNVYALAQLTAAYSLSDCHIDARTHAEKILRVEPNFSVDNFSKLLPYKNQSDTDRILNALRKAGLK